MTCAHAFFKHNKLEKVQMNADISYLWFTVKGRKPCRVIEYIMHEDYCTPPFEDLYHDATDIAFFIIECKDDYPFENIPKFLDEKLSNYDIIVGGIPGKKNIQDKDDDTVKIHKGKIFK